jgi:hypothetical protein
LAAYIGYKLETLVNALNCSNGAVAVSRSKLGGLILLEKKSLSAAKTPVF